MSTRDDVEKQLRYGAKPVWVAFLLGVSASYVRRVKRELEAGKERKTVGRPRKTVSVAEACARLAERYTDGRHVAELIRAGAWRDYR